MPSLKLSPKFIVILFLFNAYLYGQSWAGILSPARAIDWSRAGVAGGIPTRTTQCVTSACNTVSSGTVTASSVQAALNSAPTNTYVLIPAGTFTMSTGVVLGNGQTNSNITVRGMGADKTILKFNASNGCTGSPASAFCMRSSDVNWPQGPTNTATWTSTQTQTCPPPYTGMCYARGATQITLSSVSNLAAGEQLILDQLDDSSDNGAIYVCGKASCSDDTGGGPSGAQRSGRNQIQIVTVTNVAGNVVTFTPGLYMNNWRSSQSPGAWWASNPAIGFGVESMTVDNTNAGGSAVSMFNCVDCYVKGIRSIKAGRSHVWMWQANRATVRDSYFYESQSHASQSYGIEPYPASDVLVENNIFQSVTAPVVVNGACSGCVLGYNFSVNNVYTPSNNWFSHQSFMHAGGIDFLLLEGNNGEGLYSDLFHGSHQFVTAFRNRYTGWEVAGGSQRTSNAHPMNLWPLSRFYNLIGNVLGTSTFHNNYQETPTNGSGNSIYVIGTGTVNVWKSGDQETVTTLLRWGNWDTVTSTNDNGANDSTGTRFIAGEVPSNLTGNQAPYENAVPANQTLPSSFYMNSKPAWFGTIPWPANGPDVSGGNIANTGGHANMNPAHSCYANIMSGPADGSGSVLMFNADSCYGGIAPDPPQGVTAVAH